MWCARLIAFLACACLIPASAQAQYFGQNKVQYERFEFQTLHTENFDIYHYPAAAASVRHAARLAEGWRTRLALLLGFDLPGRQPLVLYASHPDFTQTQVIGGLIGEGTGGVTESLKRRMVLPFGSSLAETNHVLGHEMVHAFQYAVGGDRIGALPLWFIEGMAEFLSVGPDDAHTAMWLRDLAAGEALPALDQLNDPRYFPYRVGHAVWAYLASRFGTRIVGATYLDAAQSGDPLGAIERTTGTAIADLSRDWQAAIRAQHGGGPAATPPGRVVVSGGNGRRVSLNVAPALSPDGRWLAYLSERGLFSIDVYLADAATGRVVRRLTASDTDPHLESLQFIASAGAWDSTSQRFAFTTITRGQAALTVVEVAPRAGERTFPLELVDEAWHPTWAPDGLAIAFAGLSGGVSDLYAIDLASAATRRLTNDAFADVQPAWSPDGRTLAFVTDRFSSSLETLSFGALQPALLRLADQVIEPLPSLPSGKHLNPQWDRDGTHLFLIAAPDGAPNVYRLNLARRDFARVTDVATGVSGITAGSPALSYARQVDRLAFSVLRGGGYDIHVLDAPGRGADAVTGARPGVSRSRLFSGDSQAVSTLNLPGGQRPHGLDRPIGDRTLPLWLVTRPGRCRRRRGRVGPVWRDLRRRPRLAIQRHARLAPTSAHTSAPTGACATSAGKCST